MLATNPPHRGDRNCTRENILNEDNLHQEFLRSDAPGTVVSVNVGGIRQFDYHGHPAASAIWKSPALGRIAARGVNLEGDDQADREVHGGPDKAVYAYAIEDLRWWGEKLGRELDYGQFGENLTTEGLDVTGALVGERWEIGSAVFEVSEPRVPCWRFAVRMEDNTFPKQFTKVGRPGAYLRIATEGDVAAGDEIRVVDRPDHDLTIGDIFRIFTHDRHEARRILEAPQVSSSWRQWAERHVPK
jgi:MOSC domain-containing protein YiiM